MSSHQAANEIASLVDLEDLICGLTILGTGGGGRPEAGRAALVPLVEAGARLVWTSLESLPDGGTYCSLGGLGSIAPIEPLGDDERQAAGYPLEMIPEQPMVVAARALQGLVGRTIDGVYPVELGAGNSTTTLAASVAMGVQMIDCDCAGRAIPEMTQSSVARAGIPFAPAAFADHWGMVTTVLRCHSTLIGERLGKSLSLVTKAADMRAQLARAAFLVDGATLKRVALPGGLTRALALGRAIAQARRRSEDPVSAAVRYLGGQVIGRGELAEKNWETRGGYMFGDLLVRDAAEGPGLKVWLKNENHIVWRGNQVLCTSPDLICIVGADDACPYTNTQLAVGQRVAVIVAPAPAALRTPEAVAALGPAHYGFNIPYVPLEAAA